MVLPRSSVKDYLGRAKVKAFALCGSISCMTHGLHPPHGGTAGGQREGASHGEMRLVVGSWSELPCCQPDTAFPFLFSTQSRLHLMLPLRMPIQLTWPGFKIPLFCEPLSIF